MIEKFWNWYEKHLALNTVIAAGLFTLQLVHLYWLTTHVVFHKALSISLWDPSNTLQLLVILIDYTEIPALVTTSLVYINEQRKKPNFKNILYLIFLNIQFLHIFWITDEFVVENFTGAGGGTILPFWLAWVAILIDYLELPVIYDTLRKTFSILLGKL